jgi:sterol desaturase/sphingolipid hydroxylase (fatty acid hydroxylase superfamily)
MDLSPVVIAIPMYFTLMGIELVVESITRRRTYRLNDAITNINAGVVQQITGTFLEILKIGVYVFVYEHWAFAHLERNWYTFAAIFILWDFCYYWDHRFQHVISLFWGGHSVHHQSEEYNLSVALRQSSTSVLWGFPVYLPLALIGFSPIQFAIVGGLNLLYQFWIHTEHINLMPRWFEYIFNTPSHHRVHHGRDIKYLDKNYAGVFIIWDRMFGSFKQEEERPNYGVTKPLKSWNPVYANVAHYVDLFGAVKKARSLGDGLRILFMPPGWYPAYLGGFQQAPVVDASYQKFDNKAPTLAINVYILVHFLISLGVTSYYLFNNQHLDLTVKIIVVVWIVFTSMIFGFLFENRSRLLLGLELVRLLYLPVALLVLAQLNYPIDPKLTIGALVYALLSGGAFVFLEKRFFTK